MSKILWCLKSILYGGKLGYIISGMLLAYLIYFSIAFSPETSELQNFIHPIAPRLIPSDKSNRFFPTSFMNKEILAMKSFDDDKPDPEQSTLDQQKKELAARKSFQSMTVNLIRRWQAKIS